MKNITKKKIKRTLKFYIPRTILFLCIVFFLWVIISYGEVIAKQNTPSSCVSWNFFRLIFKSR